MEQVIFKKPDFDEIMKGGYNAVDMHLHSKYSDGVNKVKTIIKMAAKIGFGISITDHNEIKGAIEASNSDEVKSNKVMFVPSIELNCMDGPHLLCYFYDINELVEFYERFVRKYKMKNPNGRIKKTINELTDKLLHYNCIISLAHPFGPAWINIAKAVKLNPEINETLKKIHALELISGAQLRKKNLEAIALNSVLNKCFTGGSDGHTLLEFGSTVTYAAADNAENFLDAIRLKNNFIVGKEITFPKRLFVHPMVFRKHVPYLGNWMKEAYRRSYPNGLGMRQKIKRIKSKMMLR